MRNAVIGAAAAMDRRPLDAQTRAAQAVKEAAQPKQGSTCRLTWMS